MCINCESLVLIISDYIIVEFAIFRCYFSNRINIWNLRLIPELALYSSYYFVFVCIYIFIWLWLDNVLFCRFFFGVFKLISRFGFLFSVLVRSYFENRTEIYIYIYLIYIFILDILFRSVCMNERDISKILFLFAWVFDFSWEISVSAVLQERSAFKNTNAQAASH